MQSTDGNAAPAWLRALSRRGSFLQLTPNGAEVFTPRNQFAAAVASIDRRRLAAAIEAGLLREIGHDRFGPSPRGLAAVRALRSEEAIVASRALPAPSQRDAPAVNASESPLGWLYRRRDKEGKPLIRQEEFDAGERLRADFWFAQMTPRTTSRWDGSVSSSRSQRAAPGVGIELQDNIIAARERVRRALEAVGPELSGILIDICCHLNGLEEAERAVGWPQRSGKVVLQLALTRLARHYGLLPVEGLSSHARQTIRHWSAPDYRPSMDA